MPRLSIIWTLCGLFVFASVPASAQPKGGAAPVPVIVGRVVQEKRNAIITLVGDIEATKESTVASRQAGYVMELLVQEGDRVTLGQPLIKLDTELLDKDISAANALLEARQQELDELVKGARSEVREAANARWDAAQLAAKLAKSVFDRADQLRLSNAVSTEEFEQAEAQYEMAEARAEEMKAAWQELENGTRPEQIKRAEAMVAQQQAIVGRLERLRDRYTVKAPFEGHVVAEHTEEGEWVEEGGPVVDMVAIKQVDVRVNVPARYAADIRMGTSLRVASDSFAGGNYEGKVAAIVNRIDLRTRLFPVLVRMDNVMRDDQPTVMPGMLARVDLPVGEETEVTLVPKDALVLGGPSPAVYRVVGTGEQKTVEPISVGLKGWYHDGIAVVTLVQFADRPLKAGDLVVVEGNERLRPNSAVTIIEQPSSSSLSAN